MPDSVITSRHRAALARGWRRAVLDLCAERERRPRASLRVGEPEGFWVALDPRLPGSDASVRTDQVAVALLRSPVSDPRVWLVRSGAPTLEDTDAAWASATHAAAAELGVRCLFAVVTRTGWFEPFTGQGRTWRRIRDRR